MDILKYLYRNHFIVNEISRMSDRDSEMEQHADYTEVEKMYTNVMRMNYRNDSGILIRWDGTTSIYLCAIERYP